MAAAVDTAPILGSATLSHATRHPKTTHDPEPKPAKQDKKLSAYVTVPSRLSLGGKTEYDEAFLPFVRSDAYGDLGCGTLNRWEQARCEAYNRGSMDRQRYPSPITSPHHNRLAVLTVLVLPIKLIMFFLIVFSFYLYCKLSLLLPPRLRRRCIRPAGKLAARSAMFSLGFLRVTWIKSQDGPDPPYAAIVGNHSSPVDIFLCMSHYFPSFLSKTAVANYPMIGPIAQCMDCVFVDITSKAEKDQGMGMSTFVKQRIESVLQPGSDLLPMCVFPEGTTRCVWGGVGRIRTPSCLTMHRYSFIVYMQ